MYPENINALQTHAQNGKYNMRCNKEQRQNQIESFETSEIYQDTTQAGQCYPNLIHVCINIYLLTNFRI